MKYRRFSCRIAALLMLVAFFAACAPSPASTPPRSAGEVISDALITAEVKTALAVEPGVKASEINVDTDRGTVTLHGQVGSQAERQLAVKVAEDVGGVKAIINQIAVRG
jgi:osmotically-inducible protein OsmY